MSPAIGIERRKRAGTTCAQGAEVLDPGSMDALSGVVRAFYPRARLTVVCARDDELDVLLSVGAQACPVGTLVTSSSVAGLRQWLGAQPSLVLSTDDPLISEQVAHALRRFDFRRMFVGRLHANGVSSEFVLVDEPGMSRSFDDRDKRLLQAAVAQTRMAQSSAELQVQASKRQRILEAVARLGVVFTSMLDLRESAEQIVEYTRLLLRLPAAMLLFRPDGASEFIVLAAEGLPEEATRLTVKPIEIAALDTGRAGPSPAQRRLESSSGPLFEMLEQLGMSNMFLAPLVLREDKLRGMLVGLDRRSVSLTDEEMDAFHLLGQQATNAIWNSERYEAETRAKRQARQELDRTGILLRAADALAGSLDLPSVLASLVEVTAQASGAGRIRVSLYDPDRDEIVVQSSRGTAPMPGTRFSVSDFPPQVRQSIIERRTVIVDYESEPGVTFPAQRSIPGIRLAVWVPIVSKGRVLGHVTLDDPGRRRDCPESEMRLIEALASQAAVSIENALLFQQQRDVAEMLQEALLTLPDRIEGIAFGHAYVSASTAAHVGGDFYDVFDVGEGRVGIIIGDISGKGLEAAVMTSLLKTTIRAHTAEPKKTPGSIMHWTNEVVFRGMRAEQFATAFFGLMDRDGRMRYANAGHTTGAVIRADGVSRLASTGPLVGAFPDLRFDEGQTQLETGDVLFLYTDGLIEARDPSRQLYGEERLFDFLSGLKADEPQAVVNAVWTEVQRFSQGNLNDDLALLAISRDPR